jgi:hypothetical protein
MGGGVSFGFLAAGGRSPTSFFFRGPGIFNPGKQEGHAITGNEYLLAAQHSGIQNMFYGLML